MSSSIPINITSSKSVSPSEPQQSSSLSSSFKNVLFHELQVTISSAKFTSKESTPTKQPDIYVELYVDDSPVHKTECINSNFCPKWNTEFPILVTPYSKLTFKVFHKTSLTKDKLLGDNSINLYDTLKRLNGKIDNLSMPLILEKVKQTDNDSSVQQMATSISLLSLEEQENRNNNESLIDLSKPNYLFIKLNGLEIDMSQYPPKSPSVSPNVSNTNVAGGQQKINSKNKSTEKHSTRSLPRLFRGSKNHSNINNNNSNNNSSTTTSTSNQNEATTALSAADNQQQMENLINGGFQSTLPRWSLNDPNSNNDRSTAFAPVNPSPYPRQPPPIPQHTNATLNAVATLPQATPGQYPTQQHPSGFSITNNTNQVASATITTTEFQEELPQGKYYIK